MQGSLDFAHGERINKRSREGITIRVEVTKVEVPSARGGGAKEIFEKIMKDSRLGRVISEGSAALIKDRNRVAPFATGSEGMKIAGVLVTGDSKFHFSAGFPIDPAFFD
jgi:hypothetical protein